MSLRLPLVVLEPAASSPAAAAAAAAASALAATVPIRHLRHQQPVSLRIFDPNPSPPRLSSPLDCRGSRRNDRGMPSSDWLLELPITNPGSQLECSLVHSHVCQQSGTTFWRTFLWILFTFNNTHPRLFQTPFKDKIKFCFVIRVIF
ncbi:hypothetical protein OJAV_G00085660 [Oryzias javanicus]|uniref:Uncharacterized protein n=1 Tax=Oryzias javanicus TaxID=123683 RepID=A0A437CYZ1_ORYJA|nr:hypothetical protein OJAV_G00085660 [Oryzias javanicus]